MVLCHQEKQTDKERNYPRPCVTMKRKAVSEKIKWWQPLLHSFQLKDKQQILHLLPHSPLVVSHTTKPTEAVSSFKLIGIDSSSFLDTATFLCSSPEGSSLKVPSIFRVCSSPLTHHRDKLSEMSDQKGMRHGIKMT